MAQRLLRGVVVVGLEKLLDGLDFILEALLLICPAANSDVGLDPNYAVGMEHAMALADYAHALIPRSFWSAHELAEAEAGKSQSKMLAYQSSCPPNASYSALLIA